MVIGMSMMMIAMMIVVMLARSESFAFDTAGSRFSMIRGINTDRTHPVRPRDKVAMFLLHHTMNRVIARMWRSDLDRFADR